MIQLSEVTKSFQGQSGNTQALRGVSLDIRQGEVFGIIGKSGAGKSTLIRCINMLSAPTSGMVLVDGQELTRMPEQELREARKRIGMIFQHFNLLSSRTVYDNVAFPLELAGWRKDAIAERVLPLLELVGLRDKKDQYPAQLSGGQKQRVGIARALASQPRVLLCDEATSALDPQTTKSILDLLKDINEKFKLTIVIITHEMNVIKEICDRVAVIENGEIVEQGDVIDIFTKPQHHTTREFIRTVVNTSLPAGLADMDFSAEPQPESNLILRLSFIGQSAGEPIIASMIRKFDVDANILYGNIDQIQHTPYGTLVIELCGTEINLQSALKYLGALDLKIEVIGYVSRHARAIG